MQTKAKDVRRLLILMVFCLVWPVLVETGPAHALDRVVMRRDGKEFGVEGKLLVEAEDGGLLILARDGVLWAITPEEKVKHTTDELLFRAFSKDEMQKLLLAELPPGFKAHQTAHYLICYDTSEAYARWCGALFERLHRAFTNYWSLRGFELSEPELPLVAIVFAQQDSYIEFTRGELGDAGEAIHSYFSLRTNRMTMYDLTGIEALRRARRLGTTSARINQILSQPKAAETVANTIHEATHQIAFNCGLHQRYSSCPVWFSEGIATYFETPDLRSSKGWRGIGTVNRWRLARFRRYLRTRPANSLESLLADDKRFHDVKQSKDAYAEAWALTYYLIRRRGKQYVAYLKMLSKKAPAVQDDPKTRLQEFQDIFGDLKRLDRDLLRHVARVR